MSAAEPTASTAKSYVRRFASAGPRPAQQALLRLQAVVRPRPVDQGTVLTVPFKCRSVCGLRQPPGRADQTAGSRSLDYPLFLSGAPACSPPIRHRSNVKRYACTARVAPTSGRNSGVCAGSPPAGVPFDASDAVRYHDRWSLTDDQAAATGRRWPRRQSRDRSLAGVGCRPALMSPAGVGATSAEGRPTCRNRAARDEEPSKDWGQPSQSCDTERIWGVKKAKFLPSV